MSAPPPPSDRPAAVLAEMAWLRRLARSLTADPSVADDLVQETWLASMRCPPDGDRPLRPWLSRVLRNAFLQRHRSEGRRVRREEAVSIPENGGGDAGELAARVELQRALSGFVLELDEPYRTTLLLRFWEDLSAEEIGNRTATPAATVRTRIKRGLERLRLRMDDRFQGDRRAWCLLLLSWDPKVAPMPGAPSSGDADPSESLRGPAWPGRGQGAVAVVLAVLLGGLGGVAGVRALTGFEDRGALESASTQRPSSGHGVSGGAFPRGKNAAHPHEGVAPPAAGDVNGHDVGGAPGDAADDASSSMEDAPDGGDAASAGPVDVDAIALDDSVRGFTAAGGAEIGVASSQEATAAAGARAAGLVAGRVFGPDGLPAADAEVLLFDGGVSRAAPPDPHRPDRIEFDAPVALLATRADEAGRFRLRGAPAGALELRVFSVGAAAVRHPIAPLGERTGIRVDLDPERELSGAVVDSAGEPVYGAVPLLFVPADPRHAPLHVLTSMDGTWILRGGIPGPSTVAALVSPGRIAWGGEGDGAGGGVLLRGVGDADFTGSVSDPDGRPVEGARVVLARPGAGGFGAWTDTDADGAFRFTGLPAGPTPVFRVERGDDRVEPLGGSLHLAPGRNARFVVLTPASVVQGTVTDASSGAPLPGAPVFLASPRGEVVAEARADGEGHYRLTPATEGEHFVFSTRVGRVPDGFRADAGDDWIATGARPVILQSATKATVDVASRPVPDLEGWIDGDGASEPPGTQVSWEDAGEEGPLSTLARLLRPAGSAAAADGSFRMPGPPPGLPVRIVVRTADGAVIRTDPFIPSGVAVRVPVPRAKRIRGTVIGEDGVVPPHATVEAALDASATLPLAGPAAVDSNGSFSLATAGEGVHVVTARAPGHRSATAPALPGDGSSLVLVLRRAPDLGGQVVDRGGFPAGTGTVRARLRETPVGVDPVEVTGVLREGRFLLENLEEGVWILNVHCDDGATGSSEALAGDRAVQIVVSRGLSMGGRALLPGGFPAAGATVRVVRGDAAWLTETRSDGTWSVSELSGGEVRVEAWKVLPGRPPVVLAVALTWVLDGDATGVELPLRQVPR